MLVRDCQYIAFSVRLGTIATQTKNSIYSFDPLIYGTFPFYSRLYRLNVLFKNGFQSRLRGVLAMELNQNV